MIIITGSISAVEYKFHGLLEIDNKLANGNYNFNVELFDNVSNGEFVSAKYIKDAKVIDGAFTLNLDFQSQLAKNKSYWLEINVRLASDTTLFHQLLPRQQLQVDDQIYIKKVSNSQNVSSSNRGVPIILTTLGMNYSRIEASSLAAGNEDLYHENQNLQSYDLSLQQLLTEDEYERVSHMHDSLREVINADLNDNLPTNLADFLQNNGTKLSEMYLITNNQLAIDLTTGANPEALKNKLNNTVGIKINAIASTPSYSVISIISNAESLFVLSQLPELKSAIPAAASTSRLDKQDKKNLQPIMHFSQGLANNQAEQAMEVDAARRVFNNLTGSGIQVGTLSDSVGQVGGGISDSRVTGDLPNGARYKIAANVANSNFKDEGRAMMEHIYDISPSIDFFGFATAFGGKATFANNITWLVNQGMGIIVDDVVYPSEPFYQDGVVAQAVEAFVNQGGIYFVSANNQANSSYEKEFSDSDNDDFHNFDGSDELFSITVNSSSEVKLALQWAQPWANATTNLDFELRDLSNNIVASSTTNNIGGNPYEFISLPSSSTTKNYNIVVKRITGNASNLIFKFISFSSGTTLNEYANAAAGTINPHGATKGIAMGAAPWFNRDVAEGFSSQGPHKRFFDKLGNPVGPFIFDKPDFMGIDGANTSFFGSTDIPQDSDALPNFFGTSASAPNAAAVAALMLQQAGGPGSLDANDIEESIRLSAIDLGNEGFDKVNGHGRINALGAIVLAKGAQSIEYYLYLNQFGDTSFSQNLFGVTDIDRFMFSSNIASATTIDITESDQDMDPMIAVFIPLLGLRMGVDYNSGPGDDAKFSSINLSGLVPHSFEVLTESDFSTAANFTAIVNAGNQNVTDRTGNLNVFGKDLNIASSLSLSGDSQYYQYTAPYNGDLKLSLTTTGFRGMLRLYDNTGGLLVSTVTVDGTEKELEFNQIISGTNYVIQVVPFEYVGDGSFVLDVEFFSQSYVLTMQKIGNGIGTVTDGTVFGIYCGINCSHNYAENSTVELDVLPTIGHTFTGWSENCNVLGNGNCEVLMTSDTTVTAEFQAPDEMFADGFE